MNKTYILFSSFKRDIYTLVFPEGMAEQRVPMFRNLVVNGLINLTTFIESYQLFNVGFYDKDQSFDDCGTSLIQACRGQIGAVYAFKPSCKCERYFYDPASIEKLSCLYDACKCSTTGCTPNPLFSLSAYTRDPYYCADLVDGNAGCKPPYLAAQPEDDCAFKKSDRYFAIGPGNKLWLYPRFPCGYVVAVHWRGIPRGYLDTDYILDDDDLKDAVACYVQSEVAHRVDEDHVKGDKLYLSYRAKGSDILYREERDLKPRATRTCVEGIDRSELVQMYPSNPYPVYVGYQCAQKKTELIEPLTPVYPDDSCRDTFTFSWPIDGAVGMDVIETADSDAGPWYYYITVTADAAELAANLITIEINNSFNGQRWFRLARNGVVFRDAVRPLASIVEMPTNIDVSNTVDSPYSLHMAGPFALPVSSQENALINPTAVYVEPVSRLEYSRDIAWDGLPTTVTLSSPAGSTAKWTRNGTDPTAEMAWPPPVYDGSAYNARVYYPDFGMAIRARCFSGECKSPLAIVLVDIRHNTLEMTKTTGQGLSAYSSCDLPKTVGSTEYESGLSCAIYHNGTDGFKIEMEEFACGNLTGPSGISGAGARTIYRMSSVESVGSSWGGWPAFLYTTSKFLMQDLIPSGYRDNAFWNASREVYEYSVSDYASYKHVIAGPGLSGNPLAGSGGTITDHAHALGLSLLAGLPHCIGGGNISAILTDFKVLRSLQNDEAFLGPPQPPSNPTVEDDTVPGDDMESYVDTGSAELAVLNGGIGWNSAWTIFATAVLIGEDDMQYYSDGSIIDTVDTTLADPTYNGGAGWYDAWKFYTDDGNVVGGDDFQSYSDGDVLVGNLNLGSRWDTVDAFWWIWPGMELGGDDFEAYTDGSIVDESLNLGDRWIGAGWKIN